MIDLFKESSAHTIPVAEWAEGTATRLDGRDESERNGREEVACQNESSEKRLSTFSNNLKQTAIDHVDLSRNSLVKVVDQIQLECLIDGQRIRRSIQSELK